MRIRLARVARWQSQGGLAEQVGVSRVTLGSIERGEHAAMVTAYVRLARALGLSQRRQDEPVTLIREEVRQAASGDPGPLPSARRHLGIHRPPVG